jgi:L-rhamnose isomerase/sugar isomerase
MARIFYELYRGGAVAGSTSRNWAYMLDQASGKENRVHAIIHSIDSLHLSLAKAALVDSEKIQEARKSGEIMLANRIFNDAIINADVRPIVAKARMEKDLPVDPVEAYVKSGYQKKIESARA